MNKPVSGVTLEQKLENLPDNPGVYLWKDEKGDILYIGKAKILKNRIRSYMNAQDRQRRINVMISKIRDLEWIVTSTEGEAFVLEDHLIKTHRPRYNIRLKDNKTYPYIKLDKTVPFPRLYLTRTRKKDGSEYFGPYLSAFDARSSIAIIHKYFPLRKTNLDLTKGKVYRPCMNYQLGRCLAPCAGKVTKEDYNAVVQDVRKLLKGDFVELMEILLEKMNDRAEKQLFEEAAKIRDQIKAVRQTLQKQRVVSPEKIDRDVFCVLNRDGMLFLQVLFIRAGALLSGDFISFKNAGDAEEGELVRSYVGRYYLDGMADFPDEIIADREYEELKMLVDYAGERRGKKVYFHCPERGQRRDLLEICISNAEDNFRASVSEQTKNDHLLELARKTLHLKNLPGTIECFDISNTSGTSNVASMVVFENGKPQKSRYRKFKIKSFEGADDFRAMHEVISRRILRGLSGEWPFPDLWLIDGGKGQLSTVHSVMVREGVSGPDLIGLAKGRSEKREKLVSDSDLDFEYVVKPNMKNPITFHQNSPVLLFLKRIRDETHRTAVGYHQKTRAVKSLGGALEKISGIGPAKRKKLLDSFRGLKEIKAASAEELAALPGISAKDAENIFTALRKTSEPASDGK